MWHITWVRRLIRRNTRKIPADKAVNWKQRLSVLYMVLTWHAFGGVLYMCYTGKRDWMRSGGYVPDVDVPPARSWAHALDIKNAQVYQVSGLKLVGSYEIKEDDGYDYENFKEKKNTDDEAKESEKEEE